MLQRSLLVLVGSLVVVVGCTPVVPGGDDGAVDDQPSMDDGSGGSDGGGSVSVGDFSQQAFLAAFDPFGEDLYGDSVTVFGDIAMVGSQFKNSLTGIADVFVRVGGEWRFLTRLDGSESRFPEQSFGASLAVSNRYGFVGAPKYAIPSSFAIQTGAVYVYENIGPSFELRQILTVNDADDFELVGSSLSFESDQSRLIAGATGRGGRQGAAYVFALVNDSWMQEARLEASDGIGSEEFGRSVAIDKLTAACGAPVQNFGTGAVYVYSRGIDWTQSQRIVAFDGTRTDMFGSTVALEGDTLVIAADGKKRPGDELLRAGAVYIYARVNGQWELEQKIVPNDADAGLFGSALGISNGVIAIGLGSKARVALYEKVDGTWIETGRVAPEVSTTFLDSFANALGFSGTTLIVGARSADVEGQRATGAAYVFESDNSGGVDIPDGVRF